VFFISKNVLEKRKWYQNPITQSFNEKLAKSADLSDDDIDEIYLSGLLEARGIIDLAQKEAYLNPQEAELFDPFLFNDMLLACEIISETIKDQKKIMIFGDYDCDGLTATAIMVRLLKNLDAQVEYMIPDRIDDGYGLGDTTLKRILDSAPDLLITVDCGINNHAEIDQLMSEGIKVIVSDHHQPDSELCGRALAVLNPQLSESEYPFKGLSGAGVAFKLAQALLKYLEKEEDIDLAAELCLAAVGTVADSMPLESENRTIVALATSIFSEQAPLGLRLMTANLNSCSQIEASFFAFSIGPRLNAAGRMGKIEPAIKLLLSEDRLEIEQLLLELEELNNQRKALEQKTFAEAVEQIEQMPLESKQHLIIVADTEWHTGIIGIVSSRLVDRYSVPVITFAGSDQGYQGSARSIGNFDILSAIDSAAEYTVVYGGHIQAAGVTVKTEDLTQFKQQVIDYAMANPVKKSELEDLQYQYILPHELVTDRLAEKLTRLEPYGQKNEKPNFVLENVEIEQWRIVGQGKHASLSIRLKDNRLLSAIAFNAQDFSKLFRQKDKVDLLVNINWQEWNSKFSTQLQILDWRVPFSSNLIWQDIARIEESYQINQHNVDQLIKMYGLTRGQFEINNQQITAVTRYILQNSSQLERGFNVALLARAIVRELKVFLNPFILIRILSMLEEIDFIECERFDQSNYTLTMKEQSDLRKNIQDTDTWKTLHLQELMLDVT